MGHLGEDLLKYRNDKGWNQKVMAKYVGVSERTYQTIEKTGRVAKADDLARIKQKIASKGKKNPSEIGPNEEPFEIRQDKKGFETDSLIMLRELEATVNIIKLTVAKHAATLYKSDIEVELQKIQRLIDDEADRLLQKDKKIHG